MFATMRVRMSEAVQDCPKAGAIRAGWIYTHPAQTILAAGQCRFVESVETALDADIKTGGRN